MPGSTRGGGDRPLPRAARTLTSDDRGDGGEGDTTARRREGGRGARLEAANLKTQTAKDNR